MMSPKPDLICFVFISIGYVCNYSWRKESKHSVSTERRTSTKSTKYGKVCVCVCVCSCRNYYLLSQPHSSPFSWWIFNTDLLFATELNLILKHVLTFSNMRAPIWSSSIIFLSSFPNDFHIFWLSLFVLFIVLLSFGVNFVEWSDYDISVGFR